VKSVLTSVVALVIVTGVAYGIVALGRVPGVTWQQMLLDAARGEESQ